MGLFDKLKNALFEEEYVEIEEKPKKPKKKLLRVEMLNVLLRRKLSYQKREK